MDRLVSWWKSGLSPWVKFVYLVLMANGVPAFIVLILLAGQTKDWFVWTITPDASARLLGVMYLDAILLVVLGFLQPNWARARITMVVITPFSIAATLVTFFHLSKFLEHPWYHLVYWLSMYLILFAAAPVIFFWQERAHGGRLTVQVPLSPIARGTAIFGLLVSTATGLGLFIDPTIVNNFWPWGLTPLVGRILAVWFSTLALAYAWALWDGDWVRTRPIFWQAIPSGLILALLPLLHSEDMGKSRGNAPILETNIALTLFVGLALTTVVLAGLTMLVEQRQRMPLTGTQRARPPI